MDGAVLASFSGPLTRPSERRASRATTASLLLALLETEVEGPHRVLVEGAGQETQDGTRPQGGPCQCLAPDQGRGFIGREEAAVVLQHHQVVE